MMTRETARGNPGTAGRVAALNGPAGTTARPSDVTPPGVPDRRSVGSDQRDPRVCCSACAIVAALQADAGRAVAR